MTQTPIRLIALTVLLAIDFGLIADVPEGAEFDADPELADRLLADKKAVLAEPLAADPAATPNLPPSGAKPDKAKTVKARVLVTGQFGEINDLVILSAEAAKLGEEGGQIDTSKAAVAYAATLEQNQI